MIASFGVLTHAHWIWMLALLGVWRLCMDYGISPRVMGQQLEIHPLLAIFTVMVVATLRVLWRKLPALRNAGVSPDTHDEQRRITVS